MIICFLRIVIAWNFLNGANNHYACGFLILSIYVTYSKASGFHKALICDASSPTCSSSPSSFPSYISFYLYLFSFSNVELFSKFSPERWKYPNYVYWLSLNGILLSFYLYFSSPFSYYITRTNAGRAN